MEFSIIGLVFSLLILCPSLLVIFFRPNDKPESDTVKVLTLAPLEFIGRLGCILFPPILAFRLDGFGVGEMLFVLAFVCIGVYYYLWVRYYKNNREYRYLFKKLWVIPVPMAVFPIAAYLFFALWGRSVPLIAATVMFAMGHITSSLEKMRQCGEGKRG